MSLLCFLSQYPLSRSAREEMEHQAKKVSNFVDGANGLENDKKKERNRKKRPPLFNESVAERLIGALYCRPHRKLVHFFAVGCSGRKSPQIKLAHNLALRPCARWTLQFRP